VACQSLAERHYSCNRGESGQAMISELPVDNDQ